MVNKERNIRVSITLDKRLVNACDKYIAKVQENSLNPTITNRSQLITQALCHYFDTLAKLNLELTKGEKKSES